MTGFGSTGSKQSQMILETNNEAINSSSPISSEMITVEVELDFKEPQTIAAMIDTGASYTHIGDVLAPEDYWIDLHRNSKQLDSMGV